MVGKLDGTTDQVLQWVNGALTAVPIGPGGATAATADQVYAWWPGYGRAAAGGRQLGRAGGYRDGLAAGSGVRVLAGCVGDRPPAVPAFPVDDTPVAAGAVSPDYFAAALTAGSDGSCASAQPGSKGERAAYVIITPAGDSADEHIVKLTAGADGTLQHRQPGRRLPDRQPVPGVAGARVVGDLAADRDRGQRPGGGGGAGGDRHRLTAAPDPANYLPPSSPAADDPCRPVYRFDVTGAQWKDVTSAGQVSAQLPPMTAQGSTDGGKTWQDLGQLMPATAPAVAADGTVTLGPASFFFQNAAGTATAPGRVDLGPAQPVPGHRPGPGDRGAGGIGRAGLQPR